MSTVQDTLETQNVVASTDIGGELDIQQLARDLNGATYDPDRFPGATYWIQNPETTHLIFRTGKVVCTGARTVAEATDAINSVLDDLNELGIDFPDEPDVTIQNIVSSADFGQRLNLNAVAIGLGLENTEYDPEQFPGLVYRIQDELDVVTVVFSTGKIVITGVAEQPNAEKALAHLANRLNELELLET